MIELTFSAALAVGLQAEQVDALCLRDFDGVLALLVLDAHVGCTMQ